MEPFRSLSCMSAYHGAHNRILALGLRRPYGSSSLGLNTLRGAQQETLGTQDKYTRNGLNSPVHFCTSKVRARGTLVDHLGVKTHCNRIPNRLRDAGKGQWHSNTLGRTRTYLSKATCVTGGPWSSVLTYQKQFKRRHRWRGVVRRTTDTAPSLTPAGNT